MREPVPLSDLRVALLQAIDGVRPHKRTRTGGAAQIAHEAEREAEIEAAAARVLALLTEQGWELTRPVASTRFPDWKPPAR